MLLYWIWFAELSDLSLGQKKALLQHFDDPETLYFATDEMLSQTDELSAEGKAALLNKDLTSARQLRDRCKKANIGILPYGDPLYPDRLRSIEDPPMLLFFTGVLPRWDAGPFVAVVGTRKATSYGLQTARQLGKEISLCGGTVVSGGASGIDSRALMGAMDAQCPSVCVLGCGVDVIYPRTNRKLFMDLQAEGCILSEYPPGEKPLGWHFLRRNRIISGLSQGVLVVEAPEKSGALNTAHHALEQGRDVYAVPANVGIPAYAGSNGLLREGAMAVITGWDAVKSYASVFPDRVRQVTAMPDQGQESAPAKVAQKPVLPQNIQKLTIDNLENSSYSVLNSGEPALTDEEQAILALLSRLPVHPDQVAQNSDLPASRVQTILTRLTLRGYAVHHPGGLVSLK